MAQGDRPPGPYRSARDLPSFVELEEQIRGGKALTRVIGRKLRPQLLEIEAQLDRLAAIVDAFYALLGERTWVFHDSLHVENVAAIVESGVDAAEAERRLVELYQDTDTLRFMVGQLNRHEAMRRRRHLVDRAVADYAAGRFDAVVLRLLAIMDGFVNDFETVRRGLHARDIDDMQAWDTVVGHHLGLAHAHKSFTRTVSKTVEDECYELHRNGIVHGTILHYDNVIIATKAWNRLFVVADWATGREKQQVPPEPKPRLRDLLKQVVANERAKKELEAWRPSIITTQDEAYADNSAYQATLAYLTAWQNRNYGQMATALPAIFAGATPNQTAGKVREQAEDFRLTEFTIGDLHFVAAAVCEVEATLTVNGQQTPGRLRWIRENSNGDPVVSDVNGAWRLYLWGPMAIINRATEVLDISEHDEPRTEEGRDD